MGGGLGQEWIIRFQIVYFCGGWWSFLIKEDLHISELMNDEGRRWDIGKLMELFSVRDVQAIMNIHFDLRGVRERIIWHLNKRWIYIVKTSYRVGLRVLRRDSHRCNRHHWDSILNINVPFKVEEFLWRALKILPTYERLRNKGIEDVDGCVRYVNSEDDNHILINCDKAKEVWRLGNFGGFGKKILILTFIYRLNNKLIRENFKCLL